MTAGRDAHSRGSDYHNTFLSSFRGTAASIRFCFDSRLPHRLDNRIQIHKTAMRLSLPASPGGIWLSIAMKTPNLRA
jgi:hypothetical protein